ncbi:MAG TPA: methylmalonyl-CoA mutase family protein [Myxococcota bacterium]|nr:methylmalonyl-CoA mutase family protein [Myxococcota bacterium]
MAAAGGGAEEGGRGGLFTPLDEAEAGRDYLRDLGFPGEPPFTRGVQRDMYRGRLWTMRQYAGFATAVDTNRRYRYLLAEGQTGLSVAFDLPTQMGRDSDHPLAAGEVGKVGVAIDSLADFEVLFDGIPLGEVSTSMTINATAPILLAMYVAVARKQGVPAERVRGTLQNDILKEYIARGTYIYPPAPSMRLCADVIVWCAREAPAFNPISISGYHMREAGADAAQELGFTLANAVAYAEAAARRGLAVDRFAPRLSFFFAVHNDFLEEVAKFRAARRLWARVAAERLGAQEARSLALRFHTQTGGVTLTAQQPDVNVVRVALQAMAAVLGGTQSLHTNSKDEALGLPTQDAVTLALRTQQVIAHESGVARWVDPLGGSYALEALTDRVEREARAWMDKIEAKGGAVAAVEAGLQSAAIEETAYRHQLAVERGEAIIVGVNRFQGSDASAAVPVSRVDEAAGAAQAAATARVRATRDGDVVARSLRAVGEAARGEGALMPLILDAVEAYATVGEISDVLRGVFGEHRRG